MSATAFFLIVVACWLAIGALTALAMARRGHEMFGWAVLGAVFGPIAIVLAIDAARREGEPARRIMRGAPGGGPTDVLVGLDGSDDAEAALEGALDVLGSTIGRLTLATVLDHGVWTRSVDPEEHEHLADPLRRARDIIGRPAEGVVLTGEPAAELARYARDEDFDLLVIGARGRGFAAVLGSVARRLAHGAGVAVMIGGGGGTGEGRAQAPARAAGGSA